MSGTDFSLGLKIEDHRLNSVPRRNEKSMRYATLFADPSGESHFDDIEIEFTATDYVQSAAPLDFSAPLPASQVAFMRAPAGWASDFYVSSARNMFVVLSGEWEVTASDGESRHFAAGSALLVRRHNRHRALFARPE